MKLTWLWITGTAAVAIGAIATGLVSPSATSPMESTPQSFLAKSAEIDPWEVFIRTDGRLITEQIEHMVLEIESLRESLAQVKDRVSAAVSNSVEMREWQMRLKSMVAAKKQMEDRRHRMFLRWNLVRVDPHLPSVSAVESPEEEPNNPEFAPFVDFRTNAGVSRIDQREFELYRPPAQKLAEIQNEVMRSQHVEQEHFKKMFGQRFTEPQMARYTLLYRYFNLKGVRNPKVLLNLTSCYSVFIIGGQRFDVNQGMALHVNRHCQNLPKARILENFQLAIVEGVQREKVTFGERYEIRVTRYSKMRWKRVIDFAKGKGADEEQARAIAIELNEYINTGALPQNNK